MSKGAKSLQEDQEGEAREAEEKPGDSSVTEAREELLQTKQSILSSAAEDNSDTAQILYH